MPNLTILKKYLVHVDVIFTNEVITNEIISYCHVKIWQGNLRLKPKTAHTRALSKWFPHRSLLRLQDCEGQKCLFLSHTIYPVFSYKFRLMQLVNLMVKRILWISLHFILSPAVYCPVGFSLLTRLCMFLHYGKSRSIKQWYYKGCDE